MCSNHWYSLSKSRLVTMYFKCSASDPGSASLYPVGSGSCPGNSQCFPQETGTLFNDSFIQWHSAVWRAINFAICATEISQQNKILDATQHSKHSILALYCVLCCQVWILYIVPKEKNMRVNITRSVQVSISSWDVHTAAYAMPRLYATYDTGPTPTNPPTPKACLTRTNSMSGN